MTGTQSESSWVKLKPAEVEKIVVELGKKNTPPEKIGLILRDQHGIPKAKIFGKKVNQILKENEIVINGEEDNISKKIDNLKKHFEKHKHDYDSKHGIVKHTQRLNKIKKQM